MRIGLAQIGVELGRPSINLECASHFIDQAARENCELVLLPELWSSGYDLENHLELAAYNRDVILPALSRYAKQLHLMIGGSLLLRMGEKTYNTFILHNSDGRITSEYSKIHLFGLMAEQDWLEAGGELVKGVYQGTQYGLSICYDLRFPELYRSYAINGVKLFLLVAEWPVARQEHWRTLLRARAIENQCFVAAVNRVGESKGEKFCGFSTIISPYGDAIVEGGCEEVLLVGDIDISIVDQLQTQIPVFADRRPDLYWDL